ncbi:hypothetical protein ACSTS3_19540 [Aquimarina muelleri]|uniref:hypothetical protein n=1 Tax=Aquimarina muelleri TaxID=279356 RepID=UPI003F6821EB
MKTTIIKADTRFQMEVLSIAEYKKIGLESIVTNVSMFFDPVDEKHTTVISYHA